MVESLARESSCLEAEQSAFWGALGRYVGVQGSDCTEGQVARWEHCDDSSRVERVRLGLFDVHLVPVRSPVTVVE